MAAKLSYNDVEDLSRQLDPCNKGTKKGIIPLMQNLRAKKWLSQKEYTCVWQSCYGGQEPALGLMHYLASSQCTTLKDLNELAKKGGCDQHILSCIQKCMTEGQGDTRLDLLPQDMMDQLATALSYEPEPVNKNIQNKWKRIAGKAGLEPYEIEALDMPAQHGKEWESLTKQLFDFIRSKYPQFKVATLAKALYDIGRVDLIESGTLEMFDNCWDLQGEKCLREVGRTLVQDIQDSFDGKLE